jgi:cytoskeletal protein RodZ
MTENNPLAEKIKTKQEEISEESQLRRKKKKINLFSLGTSLLLLVGILITIVRTLLEVMK